MVQGSPNCSNIGTPAPSTQPAPVNEPAWGAIDARCSRDARFRRVAARVHSEDGSCMAFELRERKHIEDELTRIVRRQLRRAARGLTTSADSQVGGAVHESRKAVKKVR